MAQLDITTEQIRKFLAENFLQVRIRSINNDDNILENGILDSMGILELVSFIEQKFQIIVSDEELVPENFQSIRCIVDFVQIKCGSSSVCSIEE